MLLFLLAEQVELYVGILEEVVQQVADVLFNFQVLGFDQGEANLHQFLVLFKEGLLAGGVISYCICDRPYDGLLELRF